MRYRITIAGGGELGRSGGQEIVSFELSADELGALQRSYR
jgi:hypothetical protein